jgi:hypothetical protein
MAPGIGKIAYKPDRIQNERFVDDIAKKNRLLSDFKSTKKFA